MEIPQEIQDSEIALFLTILELYPLRGLSRYYQQLFNQRFDEASLGEKIVLAIRQDDPGLVKIIANILDEALKHPIVRRRLREDSFQSISQGEYGSYTENAFYQALEYGSDNTLGILLGKSDLTRWSPLNKLIEHGRWEDVARMIRINSDTTLGIISSYFNKHGRIDRISDEDKRVLVQIILDLGFQFKILDYMLDREDYRRILREIGRDDIANLILNFGY